MDSIHNDIHIALVKGVIDESSEPYVRVHMENIFKDVLQEMRKIDSTGHFEADDEVGSTFNMLQDTINSLDQIVEDHNA